MSKCTSRLFIFTLLVVGFCIGYTVDNIIDRASNNYAKKNSYWKSSPIIVNCIGEEIKEETIQKAINYWADKDEHVLFYHYDYQKNACKEKRLDGFIMLKVDYELSEDKTKVLARTKKYMSNGQILSVEIFYKPGTYNYNLLLEHELGHAFGYQHKKILGHVMHPYYDLMGPVFW